MRPKITQNPTPPPPQPELANKGIQEDTASAPDAAAAKRQATRTGLRARYLTADTPGVNLT